MKDDIKEEIAKEISDSYYEVLLTAFEEQKQKFNVTILVIDFMAKLREKGIVCNVDDIFIDTFIDKMYVEANKFYWKVGFKVESRIFGYACVSSKEQNEEFLLLYYIQCLNYMYSYFIFPFYWDSHYI